MKHLVVNRIQRIDTECPIEDFFLDSKCQNQTQPYSEPNNDL